ncbi:MAG: hypothetical protein LBS25_03580 [Candidatus Symbiothrix sp.]|jgi:hypothetical protein|nr:hypothetical protein [Candidatus Symbiothrix sp.]
MKKRFFLSFTVMIACISIPAQNVAFLKDGGSGNESGSSPDNAASSINVAYALLENNSADGTIVLTDVFTLSATFGRTQTIASKRKQVTITSVWDGVDYRENNPNCALQVGTSGFRYVLNRPHVFKNMTFKGNTSLTSNNYIMLVANYQPVTMEEGVQVVDFASLAVTSSVSIIGGYQDKQKDYTDATTTHPSATGLDSHITVKSGRFILVGFNREVTDGTYTGTAYTDIQGGEIITLYGGTINGGYGGNVDLNISGGTFTGAVNLASGSINRASGQARVTISGGNFNNAGLIYGGIDGGSKISIYAVPDILPNLPGFWNKVSTSSPFTQQEIIIPANITATANMYNWGDIIFLSNETSTGQLTGASPLVVSSGGAVKVVKTMQTDKWYPIGFPFEIAGISIKQGDNVYTGDIYNHNDGDDVIPSPSNIQQATTDNIYLATYNGAANKFKFASTLPAANTGYIIAVPNGAFDNGSILPGTVEITFTSVANPTLNSTPLSSVADGYVLTANPNLVNVPTLSDANYYYEYDLETQHFDRAGNGDALTANLQPFQALVTYKGDDLPLRSSLNIGETDVLTDNKELQVLVKDPVVETQYYN